MGTELKGLTSAAAFNTFNQRDNVAAHVRAQDPFFQLQQAEAAIGRGLDNLAQAPEFKGR